MVAGGVKVRYFVLGLLNEQAMSGYDIKCFLESLSWLIGSPSYGSIYPTLRSLLQDERVSVEVISRPDRPPRKLYSLTEKGRQELGDWLEEPTGTHLSMKAFLMRLILADNLSPASLTAQLQGRQELVADQTRMLQETASTLQDDSHPVQRLALDYGIAMAEAELDWLSRALSPDTPETGVTVAGGRSRGV